MLADSCLARIRWLLETGRDAPGGVSAQEAVRIERAPAERGWDAEWLLSQREAVRQHRIQRFVNPGVEGQHAELIGLVLPLGWNANGPSSVSEGAKTMRLAVMGPPDLAGDVLAEFTPTEPYEFLRPVGVPGEGDE